MLGLFCLRCPSEEAEGESGVGEVGCPVVRSYPASAKRHYCRNDGIIHHFGELFTTSQGSWVP